MTTQSYRYMIDSDTYTIKTTPWGLLIYGRVPLDAFRSITAIGETRGYDKLDCGIAGVHQATFALTSDDKSAAWRAFIESKLATEYDTEPMRWLRGPDTGASSVALFARICDPEFKAAAATEVRRFSERGDAYPCDAADWGRCERMLRRLGWEDRVDSANLGAEWLPWVQEWKARRDAKE